MCPSPETPTPSSADDGLLKTFLELDTPPGYRAELIDQEIVVVPPPDGHHEDIFMRLNNAIARNGPRHLGVTGHKGLVTPRGHYIPDLTVVPAGTFRYAPSWAESGEVELVGEITFANPTRDRESKRLGYAEAGIPLYLLVDRERATTVLYSEPENGDYAIVLSAPFGKKLALPEPLGVELDTAEFL